jgi:hypothetical protein
MLEHPAEPDQQPGHLKGNRIMAKGNRTTSKARRTTAAKATKAAPVEWGTDDKGRHIVVRASGFYAHTLPVAQWQGMRTTIADLQDVADGINTLRAYPAGDVAAAMAVIAVHSVSLIADLAERARSVLALSPRLREDLAKADARMAARTDGGAQ